MCNLIPEELQDAIKVSITKESLKETHSTISTELQEILDTGCAKGMFSWSYDEEVQDLNTMLKSLELVLGWYE